MWVPHNIILQNITTQVCACGCMWVKHVVGLFNQSLRHPSLFFPLISFRRNFCFPLINRGKLLAVALIITSWLTTWFCFGFYLAFPLKLELRFEKGQREGKTRSWRSDAPAGPWNKRISFEQLASDRYKYWDSINRRTFFSVARNIIKGREIEEDSRQGWILLFVVSM